MYLNKSLLDGLKILGFDKKVIKRVSKEKSLEDIFLSTLFLNYIIVIIVYILGVGTGGYSLGGRLINENVLYGFLMIYPFIFNLIVYLIYSLFGMTAEVLDEKKHIKPLLSVGFHTAIVYTLIIYFIAIVSTVNPQYGSILFLVFFLYFVYAMFVAIAEVYNFSFGQSLIVLLTPFLILSLGLLLFLALVPNAHTTIFGLLFS